MGRVVGHLVGLPREVVEVFKDDWMWHSLVWVTRWGLMLLEGFCSLSDCGILRGKD